MLLIDMLVMDQLLIFVQWSCKSIWQDESFCFVHKTNGKKVTYTIIKSICFVVQYTSFIHRNR